MFNLHLQMKKHETLNMRDHTPQAIPKPSLIRLCFRGRFWLPYIDRVCPFSLGRNVPLKDQIFIFLYVLLNDPQCFSDFPL